MSRAIEAIGAAVRSEFLRWRVSWWLWLARPGRRAGRGLRVQPVVVRGD